MRRVDPDPVSGSGPQTHEGAGLGAVAVQHVRFQFADHALESGPHQNIGRQRLAANRRAVNAELEPGSDFRQRLLGAFAAGEAVGDDADVMAAIGLAVGEIEDMAKNAADRRARGVQDAKRLTVDDRHDQNQRAPASTSAATRHGIGAGTPGITKILKKLPPD